jgi:hypothetical protein
MAAMESACFTNGFVLEKYFSFNPINGEMCLFMCRTQFVLHNQPFTPRLDETNFECIKSRFVLRSVKKTHKSNKSTVCEY